MLDYVLLFLFGLIAGMASGLLPGLHPNLISAVILFQDLGYEKKAVLMMSVYAGYLIFSSVPAVFFGIPDERTALSVLPGQRMALEGRGIAAIKIIASSSMLAGVCALALLPLAAWAYPVVYGFISPNLAYVLGFFALVLVLRSKKPAWGLVVFACSGLLGAFALNYEMQDPFMPLFSGFFAIGAIANYAKRDMPKQKDEKMNPGILPYVLLGVGLGWASNLLPAASSPAQMAALASLALAFESQGYLAAIASINAGQFVFAFASAESIGKSRHGVVATLAQVLDLGNNAGMLMMVFVFGIALAGIVLFLARKRLGALSHIDFGPFNLALVLYLAFVSVALNGPIGFAVLVLSSAIGYATIKLGVERTLMMGSLIVPTLALLI